MKELLEQLNKEIDGLLNEDIISGQKFNDLKRILYQLEEIAIPIEPPVKPANADLNLIAGMYAVLQCQLSCVWNKVSGKDRLANSDAEKLIPKIEMLNEEIERRLSV